MNQSTIKCSENETQTSKTALTVGKLVTEVTFSFVCLRKCHTSVAIKTTDTCRGAKWQSDSMLNGTCCIAKRHAVKRHQAGKKKFTIPGNLIEPIAIELITTKQTTLTGLLKPLLWGPHTSLSPLIMLTDWKSQVRIEPGNLLLWLRLEVKKEASFLLYPSN
jgi:hypothetical protein